MPVTIRSLPKLGRLLALFMIACSISRAQGAPEKDVFSHGTNSTFAFELRQGMIFVPVRLNGSGPLSFVLDSGSTRMLVDRTRAKELGLKASGTGSLQGAGAGRIPIEFVEYVRVALPGLDSIGYKFSTADLQPLKTSLGIKVDGILGYEFLRRFAVTVDYESKNITITLPDAFHPSDSAQALPIELRGQWPYVKGALILPGPVTVEDSFLIDSGSSDGVDHPIVMKMQSRVSSQSGVGLGTAVEGATAHATSFQLGRYSVANPVVSCCGATDATSKLIGSDVLRFFTVTFDYPASQIYIKPNAALARQTSHP